MSTSSKPKKLNRINLTWEEQNPFSYLMDDKALNKLRKAIEKVRKEESKSIKARKHKVYHSSDNCK